jgi:hypothetical protein
MLQIQKSKIKSQKSKVKTLTEKSFDLDKLDYKGTMYN